MTQEKDIYERLMGFKGGKYERGDKVIVIKNPSEIQSYLRYKKGDVFEVSCHGIGMTFTKENILLFDEHIELLSKFVELPTTDTGNEDNEILDWKRKSREHFMSAHPFDWREEDFYEAINKFMPKPVEPVGLTKEVILEWFDKRDGKFHTQNQHIKELNKLLKSNKQVENNLIPLCIENIWNELWEEGCVYGDKRDAFRKVLSKYGVHTQEEEGLPRVTYHNYAHYEQEYTGNGISPVGYDDDGKPFYNEEKWKELMRIKTAHLNPPVTSTIEELATKIKGCADIANIGGIRVLRRDTYNLNKLLSSLSPMGKKRTRRQLIDYAHTLDMSILDRKILKGDIAVAIQAFMEDNYHDLLQE